MGKVLIACEESQAVRSKTFIGIANAMASQWGVLVKGDKKMMKIRLPGLRPGGARGLGREDSVMKQQDDPYAPYEEWERLMGLAADADQCWRLAEPVGHSADCPCPGCGVALWWEGLDGVSRGVLFAGMVKHGFRWGIDTHPSLKTPPAPRAGANNRGGQAMTDTDTDIQTQTMSAKLRIILTGRRPVLILRADWPVIAQACHHSWDGERECQANGTLRAWLRVREHADGRVIVYAGYRFTSRWQGTHDVRRDVGEMLSAGARHDLARTIQQVGEVCCLPETVIRDCIADLPAEAI